MAAKKRIAVVDLETDPFLFNRVPAPFAVGFYDGECYEQFWGDDCIEQFMQFIERYEQPLIIYAHNGGKFDFWFMEPYMSNPLFFIHARLVKGALFHHELRDSYAIMPIPLSAYKKDEISYDIFEYPIREKPANKRKISHYLEGDCRYLHEMVIAFIEKFGLQITMASTAMKELRKLHPQENRGEFHDDHFRPWYMGGRNECFASGQQTGTLKLYDVNSLYPYVMANFDHPIGMAYRTNISLPKSGLYFAEIDAWSNGALPVADKHGLHFPVGEGRFLACSHEIEVAREYNLLKIRKVHRVFQPRETQRFKGFVDKFMKAKIEAELAGDMNGRLHSKLIGNSGYGKFSANPRKYKDVKIFKSIEEMQDAASDGNGTFEYAGRFGGDRFIGKRPAPITSHSFWDVAIGASITSAARAVLLRGICESERPLYCDTDSIVCESLNMPLHATEIGAWKLEAEFDVIYIAGKKLYAAFKNGEGVKKASKGARLDYHTIRDVAMGETVIHEFDAPSMRLGSEAKFIRRKLVSTARR